jgi:hypothetical protein
LREREREWGTQFRRLDSKLGWHSVYLYGGRGPPTENTELQPLLSGVHSVMRVKSVLWLVRVGGARPPPLITFTLTSKVAVYAPAEWADTLTLFHLYQYVYSVGPPMQLRSTIKRRQDDRH